MKLTHLYNQAIVITRLQAISPGADKLAMSTVTSVYGHLQAPSSQQSALTNGVMGMQYRFWCDVDTDIQEGDILRDESNYRYRVVGGGIIRFRHGAMDYFEGILEKVTF